MRQLGDSLLSSGKGWFLTRQDHRLLLLLYNYKHYNPLFLEEGFGLTLTSRDGVFPQPHHLEVTVTLSGLESGIYRVRETILNQEHGSSFDQWAAMGAPDLSDDDVTWLKQVSQPLRHIYQTAVPRDELLYCALLAPHEVRLVEITPAEQGYYSSR